MGSCNAKDQDPYYLDEQAISTIQERPSQAYQTLTKSLQIKKKQTRVYHKSIGHTYYTLATIDADHRKDYEEAYKKITKALNYLKDEDQTSYAQAQFLAGAYQFSLQNNEKSLQHLSKSAELQKQLSGEKSHQYLMVKVFEASVHRHMNNYEWALQIYIEAEKLLQNLPRNANIIEKEKMQSSQIKATAEEKPLQVYIKKSVVNLYPDIAAVCFLISKTLTKLTRVNEAIEYLEKTVSHFSSDKFHFEGYETSWELMKKEIQEFAKQNAQIKEKVNHIISQTEIQDEEGVQQIHQSITEK